MSQFKSPLRKISYFNTTSLIGTLLKVSSFIFHHNQHDTSRYYCICVQCVPAMFYITSHFSVQSQ